MSLGTNSTATLSQQDDMTLIKPCQTTDNRSFVTPAADPRNPLRTSLMDPTSVCVPLTCGSPVATIHVSNSSPPVGNLETDMTVTHWPLHHCRQRSPVVNNRRLTLTRRSLTSCPLKALKLDFINSRFLSSPVRNRPATSSSPRSLDAACFASPASTVQLTGNLRRCVPVHHTSST